MLAGGQGEKQAWARRSREGTALARGDMLARGHGDKRLREGTCWHGDTVTRDTATQVRCPEAQRLSGPEKDLQVSGLGNRVSGAGCQVRVRVRDLNLYLHPNT